jgi:hypothetical protein
VREKYRRRGLGKLLLKHVFSLSSASSRGVYLSTTCMQVAGKGFNSNWHALLDRFPEIIGSSLLHEIAPFRAFYYEKAKYDENSNVFLRIAILDKLFV